MRRPEPERLRNGGGGLALQSRDGRAHRRSNVLEFDDDTGEEQPIRLCRILGLLSRCLPKKTGRIRIAGQRLFVHHSTYDDAGVCPLS